MSQLLVSNIKEARLELQKFQAETEKTLKEFALYFNGDVDVKAEIIQYPEGYGLEADLLVNNEVARHYPIADLCLLDLNELMLQQELKRRNKEE